MNMFALRLLLLILLLFGITTCLMARLNDTMLLKLPAVYSELAQEETTVERQAELMEGLNDVCRTQRQTNDSIWWVGLGTSIIACLAVTLKPRGD